jgi:hypothetical protein
MTVLQQDRVEALKTLVLKEVRRQWERQTSNQERKMRR